MVDRWTRTPFKGNTLPPGFTKEDVDAFVIGRTQASDNVVRAHGPGSPPIPHSSTVDLTPVERYLECAPSILGG